MSSALLVAIVLAVAGGVAAWWWLLHSTPPVPPVLAGTLSSVTIAAGESAIIGRRYTTYVPSACPHAAPLVLVLHGSHGDADQIRRYTGYEFERLAEDAKWIVVYPEGYRGYWNDVRRTGGYASKRMNVNDVAFLRAVVGALQAAHGVGPVFGVGYSNGGQMCIRLALDAPGTLDAMALIAASMPTPDNCESAPLDRPLPAMLIDGTDDPINPYDGGLVTIFGLGSRGTVLSAPNSAAYFAARLRGATAEAAVTVVPRSPEVDTWVERRSWRAPDGGEVTLMTVHGGGHVIPQPRYRFFRIAGRTEQRFNAPQACLEFFRGVMPVRRT